MSLTILNVLIVRNLCWISQNILNTIALKRSITGSLIAGIIYYWLSYSWDNLLLACGECNSSKGAKFEIDGAKANYSNETFKQVQGLRDQYDQQELPKTVNPEKEDVFGLLQFRKDGSIASNDNRVNYTINTCNLDRNSLKQKRTCIWNDFRNLMLDHFYYWRKNLRRAEDAKKYSRFYPGVKKLIQFNKESEFYSFRKYLVENIDQFWADNDPKALKGIVKGIIKKLIR